MRPVIFAAAALALTVGSPALSQDRVLLDLTGIKGTCETLKTPEADLSGNCHWAVMSLHYDDGRRNFSFFSGTPENQTIYAFSGVPDLTQVAEDGTVAMAVDQVFSGKATEVTPVEVSGECRFTWPLTGKIKVNCTATAPAGGYSASFVSDGAAPVVTPLH